MKQKIIVLLAAIILAAAVFSIVSADTNSLLQFFGFGKATQTVTPTPAAGAAKSQETPAPDQDPFADFDPALVEFDDQESASKGSDSWFTDDWRDDPFAYSFSESTFDENVPVSDQKSPYTVQNFGQNYGQNYAVNNGQHMNKDNYQRICKDPRIPASQKPAYCRYQFYPVFCQRCELPRTGFPTGTATEIRETVSYAKTNMSLTIPTLNVEENIVIVPLVDETFPVDNLGNDIGLLEGSGPTSEDILVLAGHNHLNTLEKGPFATLSALKVSDLIFIRGAKDASRTFVVYANELLAADDTEGLLSYARPGCMILITCEDESIDGGYLNRRVIFAEAKED
ncbi:MAG: class F sortase [Flexilinea sp.]|nr:class F sortase [Flexilinea sp.]